MTTTQRKHVVEGAFAETPNGARLLGSRCAGCGACFFPRSAACRNPGCSDKRIEDVELSPRGTLWTYTVQYYKPPPPARLDEPFTPYGIGLVDLPEGIRIMGMISSDDPESLRIGHEMELVIETLYHDDDGSEVLTWKFRALMRSTPTPPTVGLKPDPPVGRLQPGGSGFNPTRGGEGNTPGGQP